MKNSKHGNASVDAKNICLRLHRKCLTVLTLSHMQQVYNNDSLITVLYINTSFYHLIYLVGIITDKPEI